MSAIDVQDGRMVCDSRKFQQWLNLVTSDRIECSEPSVVDEIERELRQAREELARVQAEREVERRFVRDLRLVG